MSINEEDELDESVIKEHDTFTKYKVWKSVPRSRVPAGTKILTSIWAMKPKPNGAKRARLNAQACDQVE
eukprot:3111277-Ditylum_brightwellii.AAC.2